MNELTKYRNDMNDVSFKTFSHKDYNIFFAIVSRMRDKGTQAVTFSYRHLMKISGLHYGNRLSQFTRDLNDTYSKMLTLGIHYNNNYHEGRWLLFNGFDIDKKRHEVTVSVNPKLKGVLNKLKNNFTRFSLEQFASLRSPYAQTVFRLLKQYRQVGHVYLTMPRFRLMLGVPKSYDASLINRNIITTLAVELTPYIKGFEIEPRHHGRGNKIIGYDFYFSPERAKQDYFSKGKKKDMQQMVKYIKFNDSLSPALKKRSLNYIGYSRVIPKNLHAKPKREPMKIFNHWLKTSTLGGLKFVMHLRRKHSPLVNLSEYQARKTRKRIRELKKQLPKLEAAKAKRQQAKQDELVKKIEREMALDHRKDK